MRRLWLLATSVSLLLVWTVSTGAQAAVIVLANESDKPVYLAVGPRDQKLQAYRIAAGDVLPVAVRGQVTVRFNAGDEVVDRRIMPYSICSFSGKDRLELSEQRFSGDADLTPQTQAAAPATAEALGRIGTLPVMILVDDDEPAVRRLWESRLRERLQAASKIFEQHCRMRFEVVAVDTWESNDGVTDFRLSLREFERKVRLKPPARLAIGFTSQYRKPDKRRVHMGGTRGPLHPHLLVREWSQHVSESERLEILVHELGHVLGASHSPDHTSVMRPLVGDRQSRARSFRIGFDPINTLAMYVFCEQLRLGGAKRLTQFSPASKALLSSVYREMHRQFPDDTSAARYLALVQGASLRPSTTAPSTLTAAIRKVVRAVTRAAAENHARPSRPGSGPDSVARLEGDALADYYVRAASREATKLPKHVAVKAYLVGLVIALENSGEPDGNTVLGGISRRYESAKQRQHRLAVLGKPTIHGRQDLLQHFIISAALCSKFGASGAESICTHKEMLDSRGKSGFSFVDLAADIAGIALAGRLEKSKLSFDELARSFEVRDFLLPPGATPENLSYDAFKETYGSLQDARFRKQKESLQRQILALPGHSGKRSP